MDLIILWTVPDVPHHGKDPLHGKDGKQVFLLDIQKNKLLLTFLSECVDFIRQKSKYSAHTEL